MDIKVRHTFCVFPILTDTQGIQIDFNPARTPEPFDIEERMKFWESCRPWLDTKGYNLYRINSQTGEYDCGMSPNIADSVGVGHELPYSFHENPDQRDKLQAASEVNHEL